MSFRVLALVLAVVVLVTFATPAKAEAIEPLTILAIAGAAVIVLVLVIYLVVANVEGPKMSKAPIPRIARPPDISSRVAIAIAVSAGCRAWGSVTQGPSRIFVVCAAIGPRQE